MIANGTFLRFVANGAVVNCEINHDFASNYDTARTACKDSPNGSVKPGPITAEINFEALLELAPANTGYVDLVQWHLAKTKQGVALVESEAGGFTISGDGYLKSIGHNAGTEEAARFSGTVEIDGDYSI